MFLRKKYSCTQCIHLFIILAFSALIISCSKEIYWPPGPLYSFPQNKPINNPQSKMEMMKKVVGHYAHYDVVSYEDNSSRTPIRTFIVSYGFTDLYIVNGELIQRDTFCFASQKLNQKNVKSFMDDISVQAIKPREQKVDLKFVGGVWHLYRPASPTLLGITGDPLQPLSRDPKDPNYTDPDKDGKPGVTVRLEIGGFMKEELYITRREVYSNHSAYYPDGNFYGYVVDSSEQFVIDATMKILKQQSNPIQLEAKSMSPLFLIRIDEKIDTCQELKALKDSLFPKEPDFNFDS